MASARLAPTPGKRCSSVALAWFKTTRGSPATGRERPSSGSAADSGHGLPPSSFSAGCRDAALAAARVFDSSPGALVGTPGAVVGPGGAVVGPGGAVVGPGGALVGTPGALVGPGGAFVGTGIALMGPDDLDAARGAFATPGTVLGS
jgi:hypothetical protein